MDPADLPPALQWETPAWDLFARISSQWRRRTFGARYALDYGGAIAIARQKGWDLDLTLELLGAIEQTVLEGDAHDAEQ